MSKELAHLCTLFVQHVCGDLPAQIFKVIADAGQARFVDLRRHLRCNAYFLKSGLAVLHQQNILLHNEAADTDQLVYKVNLAQAYALVRRGKYTQAAHERMGPEAAAIVSTTQSFGCASAAQLNERSAFDAFFVPAGLKEDAPEVNGYNSGHDAKKQGKPDSDTKEGASLAKVNGKHAGKKRGRSSEQDTSSETEEGDPPFSMVQRLQQAGFLERLEVYSCLAPADLDNIVRDHLRANDPKFKESITGPKRSAEFREAVEDLKRKILSGKAPFPSEDDSEPDEEGEDSEEEPAGKRRKINGTQSMKVRSEHDIYRLSSKRLLEILQSSKLSEFAQFRVGESFSRLYHTVLRLLENPTGASAGPYHLSSQVRKPFRAGGNTASSGDEFDYEEDEDTESSGTVRTDDVAAGLDMDAKKALFEDLRFIYPELRDSGAPVKEEESKKSNGETRHHFPDADEIEERLFDLVDKALRILADSPVGFVHELASGSWTVQKKPLLAGLVQEELERVVEARYGISAKRVVRMMYTKGKLDEKTMSTTGLIKQRELRALLTQMQTAGYVDVQEVPRDNSRQPNRNVYLWYFDQERCRDAVLDDIYRAMGRLLERLNHERHEVRRLLEKATRTDVEGNEEKYLSKLELSGLRAWRLKELLVFEALERNDELVLLLRDFMTPPMTDTPTEEDE